MTWRPCGVASVVSTGLGLATAFAILALAPGRAAAQEGCSISTFTSNDVPKAIPDPGTAESALAVPAGDAVAAVAVRLTITHPFDSDLKLELVSPAGRVVTLAEAVGMWGHDFSNTVFDDTAASSILSQLPPFTGTFRPAEPLAAFAGAARTGRWKLRATDLRERYAGQLVNWGLDITGCAAPPARAEKPVGAPDLPPLPTGVPAGHIPPEGTIITVNTTDDDDDAGPVTVAQLLAHPGADGTISLREAIEATNNDPGKYTIRFAPTLKGKSIDIANPQPGPLPPLRGGGVLIDGDIDGDGRPDVTVTNHLTDPGGYGFQVFSGDNRLHAVALQGFPFGIQFLLDFAGPLPTHQTFAHNIVSGVEIATSVLSGSGREAGIDISPTLERSDCSPQCETHNAWVDTRLVGNRIESNRSAIDAMLAGTTGDTIRRITVAGNDIHIGSPGSTANVTAVNLTAGWPSGSGGGSDNVISDALVAYNAVEAAGASYAITAAAGSACGANNVVEDLGIISNRVQFSALPAIPEAARGFQFAISDGCPGAGQNNDVVRRVRVIGNLFAGQDDAGVMAGEPCCAGNPSSTMSDVLIRDNLVQGVVPPSELNPWGIVVGGHVNASNVTIDSNTIAQQITEPETYHPADLAGGGIAVVGGLGTAGGPGSDTSIQNVLVTNNRIDTDLAGITLLGGGPSDEDPPTDNTQGRHVFRVVLRGNAIGRVPALATRWDPGIKGISLIGGLGSTPPASPAWWRETTNCSVTGVAIDGNLVAGVVDDVSIIANFGEGASGNVAELGRPPRVIAPAPNPAPAPIDGRR